MAEAAFPPVAELLPHSGRALLLDRVLAHDAATTVCAVDPAASVLYFNADRRVPAYVGLEYMAQTIAAHGGLLHRSQAGGSAAGPRPGFFLGSRRIVFGVDCFEGGQLLEVAATRLRGTRGALRGTRGALAFECTIRDAAGGRAMVSGVLTVYLLESFEALVEGFPEND